MVGSLQHRGPDDDATWSDEDAGVFLGFRRLSILDLSEAGRQPMCSTTGRYIIVFNGEIYNFLFLREVLEADGFKFRSHSDTEVLLAAIERWGCEATLSKLRGMFAFALWDTKERSLWLARDRMGIKPLYVLARNGGLAFASEARAFHGCPLFERRVDPAVVRAFLQKLYVPGRRSILEGVERVAPGEAIRFQLGSRGLEERERIRYWSLADAAAAGRRTRVQDRTEVVERLLALLRDSVRLRLIADVPVGAFLSGGIDSSVVVAVMQELSAEPVRSFTIGFGDSAFDESAVAERIAGHLGTNHTAIRFSDSEVTDLIPKLWTLSDEPMANPSLLPTLLVSRVARESVVVALSGDGGDEVFGGYNRYRAGARLIRRALHLPKAARYAVRGVLTGIRHTPLPSLGTGLLASCGFGGQQSPVERLLKAERLLAARSERSAYESLLAVGLADVLTSRPMGVQDEDTFSGLWQGDSLEERMMLCDQAEYLPDDLLTKVDRASMWESLEARVPILDHEIVEFSWRVPLDAKISHGVTKWPLRQIAQRYIPAEILDRPKMGFTAPVAHWLQGPLRDWAHDTLGRVSHDLWDRDRIESAWRKLDAGQTELGLPLWTAAVLQAWADGWELTPA